MFRDLKEYHEIAKIYADKVSKPENLEEMTGGLGVQNAQKMRKDIKSGELKQKPEMKKDTGKTFIEKGGIAGAINRASKIKPTPSGSNKRAEASKRRREMQREKAKTTNKSTGSGIVTPFKDTSMGTKYRSTAEIRAKDKAAGGKGMSNIPSKEGNAVIGGKKLNPDFGKKVEIKKEPEISKFTKQGKPRTKAQMMAAKRIGSGTAKNPDTTIAQVKQANQDSMRARAKERFADFKAKRAEKKAAMVAKGELTPYDYVLEYLLSSEQAATIEEANHIMIEMDAETIQSIVAD